MKGGIMVRLIDVVFILLLGFISASDIIRKTQIKLPPQLIASAGKDNIVDEPRPLVIRIFIQPSQKLTGDILEVIESRLRSKGKKGRKEKDKWNQLQVSEFFVKYLVRTGAEASDGEEEIVKVEALENYIISQFLNRRLPGQKVIVALVPHPDVMIQGIVNIFDICKRHKIAYHFKYPDAMKRNQELQNL